MTAPLLQVALDSLDFEQTLALAEKVAPFADILEIGTPCIKHNGVKLVAELKRRFPAKLVLVDLKTMDAGAYEAEPFYAAGADICTVLGVSGIATIKGVIESARKHGSEVQVDLINVPDKAACAEAACEAGAQIVGVHTGLDAQAAGQTPFADLAEISALGLPVRVSVAGGINAETSAQVAQSGADIVVVGGAITGSADPASAARQIRSLLDGRKSHSGRVITKINEVLAVTNDSYDRELTRLLDGAKRVFVTGAGRSGLICRFFAMRLMHSGYRTFVVGEIVTPAVQPGDLLIIISGSGETKQLIEFTKKAREIGAQIVLISAKASSSIGDLADAIFQIGNDAQYGKVIGMPMGTVFELSTLAFLESTVSHMIHEKGIPEEEMRSRHANLE